VDPLAFITAQVLPHFAGVGGATVGPLGNGLINQTYLVEGGEARFVLQRLAPVFPAAINENLAAVTAALASAGLPTPHLVPTLAGRSCLDLGGDAGVWRLLTYLEGMVFDRAQSPRQAAAAADLVARFHLALQGLPHVFLGLRTGVHDTAGHLARLRAALAAHANHRLGPRVERLAERIFAHAAFLSPLPVLESRICHGDLKLNNVLFAGPTPPDSEQAVCLIDLDTVGPQSLAYELGDAWRSWCNRSGEDSDEAHIDLEIFRASFFAYRDAIRRPLDRDERLALLGGVEWISLELAARFAADALNESYFGWDPARYPGRGEHNLVRGGGQLALHEVFVATRAERAIVLGV
jgi:Ser/Thr protein kinase RdoA (MazF antagonist)